MSGRDGGWIRTLLEEAENERVSTITPFEDVFFFFSLFSPLTLVVVVVVVACSGLVG